MEKSTPNFQRLQYTSFDDYRMDGIPGLVTPYIGNDHPVKGLRLDYDGPEFNYVFNSLGFRGPELDTSTPALASFGCSHTVGIGIPEETRFASVFAKKIGLTNYCFAIGGSDNLSIFRNLVAFIKNNKENTNTKLILVAWSYHSRLSIVDFSTNKQEVTNTWSKHHILEINDLIVLWEKYASQLYTLELMKATHVLCQTAGIQLIQLNCFEQWFKLEHKEIDSLYNIKCIILDKARDTHYGIKTHQNLSDMIYETYIKSHKKLFGEYYICSTPLAGDPRSEPIINLSNTIEHRKQLFKEWKTSR